MIVFASKGQVTTDPFPKATGVQFQWRGGDVCHPIGGGDWFKPPYFARVWRWYCSWPVLPYFAWRIGNRGGYIGFKCYGADSEAYKNWMNPADVYPGSMALQLSARLAAKIMI